MADFEEQIPGVKKLPVVSKMNGLSFSHDQAGLHIQYEDKGGHWYELSMPFLDGMYLLSLLKSLQLNIDFPFPDDPRDPSAPVVRPSERTTTKE